MATYTTYLNLEKPTTSETFNLLKMNQNWDKIDAGVSALNSNLTIVGFDFTPGEKVSSHSTIRMRMGKLCIVSGFLSLNAQLSKGDVIATLSVSATNTNYRFIFTKNDGSGISFFGKLNASNQIVVDGGQENTASNQYYLFNLVFFAN